jgi:ABC-type bacteriocin/lantibiotic exporter with double-glycine peptidase domain
MRTLRELRYLRPAFGGIKGLIVAMGAVTLLVSFVSLAPPYLTKLLFDQGVMAGEVGRIVHYGILAIAAYLLIAGGHFVAQALFALGSSRFTVEVKSQALRRLLGMPLEFLDQKQSGYLVNRLNEVDALSTLFSPMIFQFASSLIQFAGAIGIMAAISPRITGLALLFAPLYYFIARATSRTLRRSTQVLMETTAQTRGSLQEAVSGAADLKQSVAEGAKAQDIARQFSTVATQRVRQSVFMGGGTQSIGFLTNLASVLVLMLSGVLITRGGLSVGDYMALAGYVGRIFLPSQLFGSVALTVQPVLVALARLAPLFEKKTEKELWGDLLVDKLQGHVEFRNVYFAYDPAKGNVIRGASFSIGPGERVALLGPNGSGKSTLMKLLLGFYPNYRGEILIDGVELHKYDVGSLRKRIGIISQNAFLFTGTLWENVKIANTSATDEEVERVFALSGCTHVFDGDLRRVFISEAGRNLSGGQRQAVAIARCLLKNPELVIFDEATAHLDREAREVVMHAFVEALKGKTCVLITHDPAIAGFAKRILLLENGKVKPASTAGTGIKAPGE